MAEDNGALYYAMGRDNSMNSGNSGNGFGMGGWGDLAALIVVAGLFGWGRGGFGGFGGGNGGGGVGENYVLATDFATIERKLDGVNSGLCDLGFNLSNTITQGFSGLNTAIVSQGYETRLGTQTLSGQLAQCCCDIREGISGVNYNMATNFGALNNTLCGLGRDIIENANANYRAIHEELVANKIEAKNERIAELQDKLYRADLRASQEAQTNYLISKLGYQCPTPAYVVQPPQQVTFPTNCCGTVNYASAGNGCGCC
jgi:hypothetical protein